MRLSGALLTDSIVHLYCAMMRLTLHENFNSRMHGPLLMCALLPTPQVRMDRPDPRSYWGRLAQRLDLSNPEHLVLLDVGMVAELTPDDQAHLVQFFKVLSPAQGRCSAQREATFAGLPRVCKCVGRCGATTTLLCLRRAAARGR